MKVAILGYGKSGKTAEKLLKISNITHIDIYDDKIKEYKPIKAFDEKNYDIVVVSPGIDIFSFNISKEKLTSELDLAYSFISDKKILGITGTNGKSTTTYLTAEILKNAGYKADFCGNIGRTVGDLYLDKDPDIYVIEVSSFQIDLLKEFRFDALAITNITPDHLDRYKTMEKYILSKRRVEEFTKGKLFLEKNEWNRYFYDIKNIVFVDPEMKNSPKLEKNILSFGDFYVDIGKYKLFGFHNVLNLAFALLLANEVASFSGDISHLIENLNALEHRCEFVAEINGVKYINDSKGTNVDSTLTALKSSNYPTTLILGGKDKDGDFTTLTDEINKKTSLVICCGAAGNKIYNSLKGKIKPKIVKVERLKDALLYAYNETKEGVVLFSPACASFDEFNNFEERGRFFKQWVYELRKGNVDF
jgi:UDP-N-acetylmuramoylalanine--D-glutamate ligase